MSKPIYVLGTGLSHDGSACLLKDGKIVIAVEKERITRWKHDGKNDSDAIQYCLKAEGITLDDVAVVVQNSNFGAFKFGNDYFHGPRLFGPDSKVQVVNISHHLAHAYNALGTSPYDETDVLVIDGCGSPYDDCTEAKGYILPVNIPAETEHLFVEKDSLYHFSGGKFTAVHKDFSPFGMRLKEYPMHPPSSQHSIGGMYHAASEYCFGDMHDVGKLMGLAPYGRPGVYDTEIFELKDGRVFVDYSWMQHFRNPARGYNDFWKNFQYYADIAFWIQKQVEKAIMYTINERFRITGCENLSYSGGVALNAVANALIKKQTGYKNVYITPAAGDNGLAIGCAYYGWLEVLKQERVKHNGSSAFGICYSDTDVEAALAGFVQLNSDETKLLVDRLAEALAKVQQTPFKGNRHVRLVLEDYGVLSFIFTSGGLSMRVGPEADPDGILELNSLNFIRMLRQNEYYTLCKKTGKIRMLNPGSCEILFELFSLPEVQYALKDILQLESNGVEYKKFEKDELPAEVAKLLADGKVIGWFQDECEFGPRALGRRSILADPRKADVKDFINSKIKFREDFRPFAPSVLQEDAARYFDLDEESPYMLLVSQVRAEWKDKIPGVVHANGSCRVQTVTADWNPKFYQLLRAFRDITDVSVLINTSFNKRGMPIVERPVEALSFFYECALDCLVINDYIIYKDAAGHENVVAYKNAA